MSCVHSVFIIHPRSFPFSPFTLSTLNGSSLSLLSMILSVLISLPVSSCLPAIHSPHSSQKAQSPSSSKTQWLPMSFTKNPIPWAWLRFERPQTDLSFSNLRQSMTTLHLFLKLQPHHLPLGSSNMPHPLPQGPLEMLGPCPGTAFPLSSLEIGHLLFSLQSSAQMSLPQRDFSNQPS